MNTTYVLLDDDEIFTKWLNHLIQESHPILTHLGSFQDSVDAAKAMSRSHPDILFLDMQIDAFNGLEFLEALDYRPITIVVSASEHYRQRAKLLGALDYLLKPVSKDALQNAVGKALWQVRSRREVEEEDIVFRERRPRRVRDYR